MITHCLKITFRNLWKFRRQSLTALLGLAFGLACLVPALFWMRYETSYDEFYPHSATIYRVYAVEKQSGNVNEWVPAILERKLREHFPVIESSTSFYPVPDNYSTPETPHIQMQTTFADSTFFQVFPQVFISGDTRQPLQTDGNIVLTETMAVSLFGDAEKAIGKQVQSKGFSFNPPYNVTAVVKDPPLNTNLPFDAILFSASMQNPYGQMPESEQWAIFDKPLYVKIRSGADIPELTAQLQDFMPKLGVNKEVELRMLPIGDVRHQLNTDLPFSLGFIRLFIVAGILFLFSALFNLQSFYLDLFRQRIHELRQRSVHGAAGRQLIGQMLFEITCTILLALALAIFLILLTLPTFSRLLGMELETYRLLSFFALCAAGILAWMLCIGIMLFGQLSRLATRSLAKGRSTGQPHVRNLAVTVQLAVSVVFLVATGVVMMQLSFVNRKDLGFNRTGVIQMSIPLLNTYSHEKPLKNMLATIPQIETVSQTIYQPQQKAVSYLMTTGVEWEGKESAENPAFQNVHVDSHFAGTLGLQMVQGKWWNEGETNRIVLNEEAVRVMGLKDPVGSVVRMYPNQDMSVPMETYQVAGVVKNFHTQSLHSPILPSIFRQHTGVELMYWYLRTVPGGEEEVIRQITALLPGIDASLADVRLTLLDEVYNNMNHTEQVGSKLFSLMAVICLLISLSGIYAVAVGAGLRRRKEVAVRKVMGAGVGNIIRMFFREFSFQVALAAVIALPLAYLAMERWLQGYAFRTNIPAWLLLGVVAVVAVIVLLTVLGQVLKAANANPANVMKNQ